MSSLALPTATPIAGQASDLQLAVAITKSASKQTYYTIRHLVDSNLVGDAYRAYAYFRWIDDHLDQDGIEKTERQAFIHRQSWLVDWLYEGRSWNHLSDEEMLLANLIRSNSQRESGLEAYIRNMLAVMTFDVERRGQLITKEELSCYSHSLAVAVTEAMHYFIGHTDNAPHTGARYLAVTAAHITHMLRDTLEDVAVGYFNIPREYLDAHHLDAQNVQSNAYRAWVRERVQLARTYFQMGRSYMAQVENIRCRMAGYAYMARFESLLNIIEHEGYLLRSKYPERKQLSCALQMSWDVLASMFTPHNQALTYPSGQPFIH